MFTIKRVKLDGFLDTCRNFNIKFARDYASCDFNDVPRNKERRAELKRISQLFKKLVSHKIETSPEKYKRLVGASEMFQAHAITEDTNSVGSMGVFTEKMFSMKDARILVVH